MEASGGLFQIRQIAGKTLLLEQITVYRIDPVGIVSVSAQPLSDSYNTQAIAGDRINTGGRQGQNALAWVLEKNTGQSVPHRPNRILSGK